MRWSRNLRLSARALTRSWIRTTLSVSGVAIGIASVVVLIGAGVGAEIALREALEPMGYNLLLVNAGRKQASPLRGGSRNNDTLTLADWEAIRREIPGVLRTAPMSGTTLPAQAQGWSTSVRVQGTTPEFRHARNLQLVAGRFIDDDDVREMRRVAVVGPKVVQGLFQGETPLGETLHVNGVPFRIIGVLKERGVSPEGSDEDEVLITPVTTAMKRLLDWDYLNSVLVQTVSEEAIPAAHAKLELLLRRRHGLLTDANDFIIKDQTAVIRAQQQARGSLSRIVTGLSALALGLGGIGLLAVSLLSVRERYSEIGLRLAVGGRPRDILLQFFTEALLISALGGLVGLGAGVAGIEIGASLTRWPMALSWESVVYPFTISMGIAVVFGAYPALIAARLDPIVALHSK